MSSVCHSCGRPLRDPKSVEAGIGPRCADRARAVYEPRLFQAQYFFEIFDDVLVLFDRDCGTTSLTNDMERALLEVSAKLGAKMPKSVIYRDSEGRYDRVRHRKGVWGGRFDALGATTLAEALQAVKETRDNAETTTK